MNADVTVREIMDPEYVGVSESDDLVETVELLLREEADTAVVLRGSDPLGVVTERDVLSLLVEGPEPEDAVVTDAMSESVPTIAPDASLEAAADRMSAREVRQLVVTNGAEPLGIITEHDLLTARVHQPGTRQEERNDVPAGSSEASVAMETEASPQDSFEEQGICEVCGTLTRDLAAFNGQLRCSDCRDM